MAFRHNTARHLTCVMAESFVRAVHKWNNNISLYSTSHSISVFLFSTLKFIPTFVIGLPDRAKREA